MRLVKLKATALPPRAGSAEISSSTLRSPSTAALRNELAEWPANNDVANAERQNENTDDAINTDDRRFHVHQHFQAANNADGALRRRRRRLQEPMHQQTLSTENLIEGTHRQRLGSDTVTLED